MGDKGETKITTFDLFDIMFDRESKKEKKPVAISPGYNVVAIKLTIHLHTAKLSTLPTMLIQHLISTRSDVLHAGVNDTV